jgi:DNA replication protein DnaC
METKIQEIRQHADYLRLTYIRNHLENLLHQAQIDRPGYMDFTGDLLGKEVRQRQESDYQKRLKMARLPKYHDLDRFDFGFSANLSKQQLSDLRELLWVDQIYNLILMGPSGTGKTYIAAGLIHDAVKKGYKAYFLSMEELISILKMKEITASALSAYNRLLKANLIAIDDIMMFPIKKHEAVALFNLVNHLHEQSSLIITTNKSPKEWAETLDDEVLATALLDRILFHCEVIKMKGDSYRMENRKTIFQQ